MMENSSPSQTRIFFWGFKETLAFQTGVVPFGILYATLASAAGLSWWLILLLSIVVFGGSSQLVFIDLYQHLSSSLQAVLGANIVNARHLIYSAGVSEKFSAFSFRWKLLLSYLLTDQLYAVCESQKDDLILIPLEFKPWFYFGSGFCTWIFWFVSSGLGIAFGHFIPASWNLSFAIPLMFMPLVFSLSKSAFAYITCLITIALVFFFQSLPFGLGVFFAIIVSSLIGFGLQNKFTGSR
jgi:predicted branched-subunit amino acid permease